MNRRGLTLLEMILAIGITAIIGAAIASMMAAVSNGLTSRDDGRRTAVQLATTQVRLSAYIAPARCLLDKGDTTLTIWLDDARESGTVHASEIRWLTFDAPNKAFIVKFIDFPDNWSQSMIDAADTECDESTNYNEMLTTFESSDLVSEFALVDAMETCSIWINEIDPISATRICVRFSLSTNFGPSSEALVDESIRQHLPPQEQQ
ncbi:MAG: prepilin-type N-terminal cleavage/methylation domain-containing protein [Planctomycetes bacterium]|nr:prepilin-type N-terminal cleavage/methylation domain-containing protein [Planctomycetota bacterium]